MDETIVILEKVDSFYMNAWTMLMVTAGVMLTITAVFVPILFNRFQKKSQEAFEEKLKSEFQTIALETVKETEEKLDDHYSQLYEEALEKIKVETGKVLEKLKIESHKSQGMSFHLQANYFKNSLNDDEVACRNYLIAFEKYLIGKDYDNMEVVHGLILNHCMSRLKKMNIENIFKAENKSLQSLMSILRDLDEEKKCTTLINKLETALDNKLQEV